MKTIQIALFTFMLLSINTITAQYGYGNGYGNGYGGNNPYGRNRLDTDINQNRGQEKPKEIPVEETVSKIMAKLKPELNLDALQEIAISNVFMQSLKEQAILMKNEKGSQEDQIKEFQALAETTDRKAKDFLDKEQKEKYTLFMAGNKNSKKEKSKKKNN